MFQKNEYVYYASGGVCRVKDVRCSPLPGMPLDREYYVLQSLHDPNGNIFIPVDNGQVFLRKLLTKVEAETLLNAIPSVETFEEPNAKQLRGKYVESMRKHEPREWVRVIKTVNQRTRPDELSPKGGKISETERSFSEDAKRFLYTELSIALDVPATEMENYIKNHIEKMI